MQDVPRRGQKIKYQPGYRFDGTRLTVVKFVGRDDRGNRLYLFRCDCGSEKTIRASRVKSRTTVSCGCYAVEINVEKSLIHGHAANGTMTREYRTWNSMKERCYNENCPAYPDYGARGIRVCDRWLNNFAAFLEDMGPKPEDYEIERVDNNGPYAPQNCRWATNKDQANNRRNSRFVTANGITMTVAQWSDRSGVSYNGIVHRLDDLGWTEQDAVTLPAGSEGKPGSKKAAARDRKTTLFLEIDGVRKCAAEWAEEYGLPRPTLYSRLRNGWDIEAAVTTPIASKRPRTAA